MHGSDDTKRRRDVLKTIVATGLAGAGAVGASGAASGQPGQGRGRGQGRGGGPFNQLRLPVSVAGEIVEDTDVLDEIEVGDDATFEGDLILTDLDVNDAGELVVSGRLQGTVSSNPTEQINEAFDTVLGLVEDVLGILSPDDAGECPILTLDVGEIFLDLLGLQVETSEIEIDITAVAGEGNLLGNLLCAVAGLLDP